MPGVPDYSRRDAAFKLYAQYRNISRVSKELKIPTQTLHVWKKQEDWDSKLAVLRDKLRSQTEVLKKAEDNLVLAKDIAKIKLLEILEEKVAKALLEGQVEIIEFRDLIKAMEFISKERRLLMGEPTEREVNSIEVPFMKEEDLDNNIKELSRYLGVNRPTANGTDTAADATGESKVATVQTN